MKILIIDNNIDPDSWGSVDLRSLALLSKDATVYVRRAPQEDLPRSPAPYDRIIVSGSKTSAMADASWISSLHDFIRRSLDLGKPFLGVCYGHQSLVRSIAGPQIVRKSTSPEVGWTQIELTDRAPLFAGLPESFHTFSSHLDEVASLPNKMRLLARSADCEIQAIQLEDRPAYGIQFHPERDLIGAERTFALRGKAFDLDAPFLRPKDGPKLYNPKIGETIFRNFLTL